jgi:hypothetical protein
MTSAKTASAAIWAGRALSAAILLGALSSVTGADNGRNDNQHWNQPGLDRRGWDHRGWDNRNYDHRGDGRWSGGYYSPPPVVYGRPYYAPPPVVYDPGIGIYLPGINLNFR